MVEIEKARRRALTQKRNYYLYFEKHIPFSKLRLHGVTKRISPAFVMPEYRNRGLAHIEKLSNSPPTSGTPKQEI